MKRLLFVISSVATAIMAIACDAEYVEQAHHRGKVLLIVAAAIAFLSWAIGMWNRLGDKVRYLLRSFGFMIAINVVVVAMVYLSEMATDINETTFAEFSFFLMMLLPFIDIIWIILTFVFWRKRALSEKQ
jgi:hypothetical protein